MGQLDECRPVRGRSRRRNGSGPAFALALVAAVSALPLVTTATGAQAAAGDPAATARQVQTELDAVRADIDALTGRVRAVDARIRTVAAETAATEARREALRSVLSDRVGAEYRLGFGDVTVAAVLAGGDPVEMADAIAKLDHVNASDVDLRLELADVTAALRAQQSEHDRLRSELGAAMRDLDQRQSVLVARLAVANAAVAAQQLAQAPSGGGLAPVVGGTALVTGSMACPVSRPYSFIDSFLAPRPGGRQHQGVDIFAPHGSPLFAVESGVVERARTNGLGGLYVWLVGDSGNEYYYAHNSANLVQAGQRVSVGQVIARLGNTGNAAGHPSHLHFEVHPGGGPAVNPTPFARRLCP